MFQLRWKHLKITKPLPARAKANGMTLIGGYCLLGTLVSLFSLEMLQLFTAEPYHSASRVIPFVAFAFVLRGIYYILVNILMFKGCDPLGLRWNFYRGHCQYWPELASNPTLRNDGCRTRHTSLAAGDDHNHWQTGIEARTHSMGLR